MGWREVQEIHRQSVIRKRALMNKRDSDLREEEAFRKTKIRSSEDAHKAEIAKIWQWFHDEMQREAEYVADALVGAQR
jgi:hypothetical protein